MHLKKLGKTLLGAGLILCFGVLGQYMISRSTAMGTEKEMAGMSFLLDQYCVIEVGGSEVDPETVQPFDQTTVATGSSITTTTGSAVSGETPETVTETTAEATPKPESEYANVGISIAADYVNIRKKPNTDSEILGKLYRGSAATIVKDEGDWVYIKSGSVSGYIKEEFLAIGYSAERLIDQFGTKYATVITETLNLREEKNTNCRILDLLPADESYEVEREEEEWVKIVVDGDTKGYVAKEYVKISVQFKKAVSIEEEREEARRKEAARAAEAAEREALQQAAREKAERERQQQQQQSSNNNSNSSNNSNKNSSKGNSGGSSNGGGGSSSGGSSGSSTGGGGSSTGGGGSSNGGGGSVDGSAVAAYALNFVGNPYVYGGTSLTNGTDCSGFALSVFKKFGVSLPRTSSSQSHVGKKISVSSARAGDLIFYASGGRVNHVAICIGGGRVVHASNPRVGITTSNMYYRKPYCARRVLN